MSKKYDSRATNKKTKMDISTNLKEYILYGSIEIAQLLTNM